MSDDQKRVLALILILVTITVTAVGVAILVLYETAITEERERLVATAQSQARLIEAVARYDIRTADWIKDNNPNYDPFNATLSQILDAHEKYEGFGETGEFTLAKREGNLIVFLFRHRYGEVEIPESIPFDSHLAEPMRKALSGLSGTLIGLDYLGEVVIAAYEPVAVLNVGIVAKIDITEIRAPFMKAGLLSAAISLILVLIGIIMFIRVSDPMIRRLESFTYKLMQEIERRKQVEEELKKSGAHLEEQVKERTTELENRVVEVETLNRGMVNLAEDMQIMNKSLELTTRQLVESNKELESFSYSVSHDLRAPLRAIDGFSKILAVEYAGTLDQEGQRLLKVITDNVGNMEHLIDDILTLSRLGRTKITFNTVDINKLIESVRKTLAGEVSDRSIRWEIKDLPDVRCDRSLFRQVFINLLSNAVKFTQPRKTARIEVGSKAENDELVFYVKDNGVGFDMRYVDKLFEVFQRLHSAEEFSGTGVGLAIVKRIIQRHGGRVWAEGKVDKGATFYFALQK